MCDLNGPFKLCTCSGKIDKKKPYWVLKTNKENEIDNHVVGMFSQPNFLFTPIFKKNILTRLNSKKNIFDFDYTPINGDLLKLCGDYDEYYCEFKNGKWKWLKNFEYLGKSYLNFKSRKRGYFAGSNSKLTEVLEKYFKLTGLVLYRGSEIGIPGPERINEFERNTLYSKQWNQKELIRLIEHEINRIEND